MDNLLKIIKHFEGCRLTPYLCPAGILTCGWGATGPGVKPGVSWTQEEADRRLAIDAELFMIGTKKLCPDLEGKKLEAIADFSYNLGLGRLKASTLRKKLNAQDWDGSAKELRKWTMAGGKVLRGLMLRREAEVLLLLS